MIERRADPTTPERDLVSYLQHLCGPARQALAGHLGRLGLSLAGLGQQLRDSVAGAIGRAASEAVRQAVATLLRQPGDDSTPEEGWPRYRDERAGSTWNRDHFRHHDPWGEPDDSGWGYAERWQRDDEALEERPGIEVSIQSGGWRSMLAALCRVLAWLLGRVASPGAGWLAFAVGLATALAMWLAGPIAGPGSLVALTDALSAALAILIG
jgi:hypothetical protein